MYCSRDRAVRAKHIALVVWNVRGQRHVAFPRTCTRGPRESRARRVILDFVEETTKCLKMGQCPFFGVVPLATGGLAAVEPYSSAS